MVRKMPIKKVPVLAPPPIAQSTVSGIQPDSTAVSGQASILAGPRQLNERCAHSITCVSESLTTTCSSGSFTYDDLRLFAEELKKEGREPYRDVHSPDEWRQRSRDAWKQLRREYVL